MSNEKKAGTYDHVTPQMVKQVDGVLAEAERHTYSVSRIYGAYNAVMQKRDTPQTCSSCLRNRVRELKQWKAAYDKATTPAKVAAGTNIGGPGPEDEVTYDAVVARLGISFTSDIDELAVLGTVLEVEDYPVKLTDEERALAQARYDKLAFENPTLFDKAPVVEEAPVV